MSVSAAALPDAPLPPDVLTTGLAVSLAAIHVLRPMYGPADAGIVDFTIEYLNPAGQRMTGLPEQPGGTALTRFSLLRATGLFDYYQRAFQAESEELTYETDYYGDGLNNTFRFAARRHGDVLVVSFADVTSQLPSNQEHRFRRLEARERASHLLAQERQQLLGLFEYAPVAVALLREPDHQLDYFNQLFAALYPGAQLGEAYAKVYAATVTPATLDCLDWVYRTGERYQIDEVPLPTAPYVAPCYVTLVYQAYHEHGAIAGVGIFAFDVTDQVLARRHRERVEREGDAGEAQ